MDDEHVSSILSRPSGSLSRTNEEDNNKEEGREDGFTNEFEEEGNNDALEEKEREEEEEVLCRMAYENMRGAYSGLNSVREL